MRRLAILLGILMFAAVAAMPRSQGQGQAASAEESLAAVETIFKQVSEITGLAIKEPVRSAVVTRDQIRTYIGERMKQTTTPEQLHAQQVALQKFGLLPKGFELERFVVDLLSEQATAYYDPRRKEFYLSDWAPLDLQKPAIAHELTHALQDQHFDLDQFLQKKGMSQDEQMARVAVVEGQGVLVMMDFMLSARGEKAKDYPNLSEYVRDATVAETSKFPVFAAAPAYLRESLLFPYTVGLTYVRAVADKQQTATFYADMMRNPPHSTHEVLHPGTPPMPYVDIKAPAVPEQALRGYKKLDSNVLGELDLFVLLRQMLGEPVAKSVTPGWQGLKYEVFENAEGAVILAHKSIWKDATAARAFADAYQKVVVKKGGEADTKSQVRGETVEFIEGLPKVAQ